jgi:uncharacterized Zn finger protein
MNDTELKRIHSISSDNKALIGESEQCGCFYCGRIFPSTDVKQYVRKSRKDPQPTTALCPHCGIDSVVSDNAVELNIAMLVEMRERWFSVARGISADAKKMIRVGDLVVTDDGYYAIVLHWRYEEKERLVELFLGNGLRVTNVKQSTLRRLTLNANSESSASANFAELLGRMPA